MPKGFSEREKAIIRANLLAKGRELFATQGIKKANVEDLTKAAGISKGAFYLFFDSKEALFFELLSQFEDDYHANMLKTAAQPGTAPKQQVKEFFKQAFTLWRTNPMFTHFNQEEYEYLLRKLPEDTIQGNLHKDDVFVAQLLAQWREQGITIECDAKMFLGLLHALFFMSIHENDFGPNTYPNLMDFFIDMIAERIVQE